MTSKMEREEEAEAEVEAGEEETTVRREAKGARAKRGMRIEGNIVAIEDKEEVAGTDMIVGIVNMRKAIEGKRGSTRTRRLGSCLRTRSRLR